MHITEAVSHGTEILAKASIDSARLDTYLLLELCINKNRAWLMAHPEYELKEAQSKRFKQLITQRSQRVPLVHLTNTREFYGLDFYIDERVLTPRVETETMVDYAIKYAPQGSRLIDIGTGSGALAITIKHHRPDLEVWATDVSAEALKVAERNAKALKTPITLVESSLFDDIKGRFMTVVTNLPYLRDDADLMPEVQKEPAVALFGGSDGLSLYRQFLEQLPKHLETGGFLFTECDPWQHEDLMKAAAAASLKPIEQDNYFILGFQYTKRM